MILVISIDIDGKHRAVREIEITPNDLENANKLQEIFSNLMYSFIIESKEFMKREEENST